MSGPPKQLTPKQIRFAQLIVYGIEGTPTTKTEAARLAGYSDAPREGSIMTNPKHYPLVCAYISNLRDEIRQKYDITYEGHLAELGKIRDQGKRDGRNLAAAATTEIARGKVGGFYIDQKVIRHGNIDDMSLKQLYERMKTITERNVRISAAKKQLENTHGKKEKEKQTEKQTEKETEKGKEKN